MERQQATVGKIQHEAPAGLDPSACHRALVARDPRFDGRFFVGVVTTGIYCRPICPVPSPKAGNVRFYPSAAAASEAGFRPCLRCRPETSPGTPAWLGSSATVSRALRLINGGALDDARVEDLAARLGMGPRHLHRLFVQHLGAPPGSVARTQRLHFAKKLLDETDLSMAQVAFSAGFGSIRRFNRVFQETYGRTPRQLRLAAQGRLSSRVPETLTLELAYRPPYDWDSMLGFLALRAIPGVERTTDSSYERTFQLGGNAGWFRVEPKPGKNAFRLEIEYADATKLLAIVDRVRRIFDLAADPAKIEAHLSRDRDLGDLVAAHPGLRLPGAWDGFEIAVRAVLGQQISVKGARTLAGRLVERFGAAPESDAASDSALEPAPSPVDAPDATTSGGSDTDADRPTRLFPTAEVLADADLNGIGLTKSREKALRTLAVAVVRGDVSFDPAAGLETSLASLTALPGFGDWTAQYVAMRALGEPDAFPASDLGLLKAAVWNGRKMTARELRERAESWRPWRAYAALYLWKSYPLS